jgi:hypothetical protein
LRSYASGRRRLCEIGVFHGVTTCVLREAMAADGVLVAVDPFLSSFFGLRGYGWARRIARREVGKVRNGRVLWVEDTGEKAPFHKEVADLLPMDFLFIDGDHSWESLKADWEAWNGRVASDAIVALHDSCNCDNNGSERYTNEVILKDSRFAKLVSVDSLTVLKAAS